MYMPSNAALSFCLIEINEEATLFFNSSEIVLEEVSNHSGYKSVLCKNGKSLVDFFPNILKSDNLKDY